MSRYAILIPCALAAMMAHASDPLPATARLGLGFCALDSLPAGVAARGCGGPSRWTIPAPPWAGAARKGGAGGLLDGAVVDVLVNDGESLWMGVSMAGRVPAAVRQARHAPCISTREEAE